MFPTQKKFFIQKLSFGTEKTFLVTIQQEAEKSKFFFVRHLPNPWPPCECCTLYARWGLLTRSLGPMFFFCCQLKLICCFGCSGTFLKLSGIFVTGSFLHTIICCFVWPDLLMFVFEITSFFWIMLVENSGDVFSCCCNVKANKNCIKKNYLFRPQNGHGFGSFSPHSVFLVPNDIQYFPVQGT